jgi:S-adenosyl-L-methionine hydrolase (adenosine-forming)
LDELTRPILLLTDFGLHDHYAGQVKSVLHSLAPKSDIIDITHGVDKYAVSEGAWMIETALTVAPPDAVFMAVVDPGVGSARRAICIESGGRSFIGPDNGLLSCAFQEDERRAGTLSHGQRGLVTVYDLSNREFYRTEVSHTFHGRDIFAPAAAARATGVPATELGAVMETAVILPPFEGTLGDEGTIVGEVIHVDGYGNLVTTVLELQLPRDYVVEVGDSNVTGGSRTFTDVAEGAVLAHIESSGFLAIAANLGNAAAELGVGRGARITVRPR